MLQGFYWDSYDYTKWENLTNRSVIHCSIYLSSWRWSCYDSWW